MPPSPSPPPPVVPWRTTVRERHLAVPRDVAWARLLDLLGTDADDLSVEPPWRHVRRRDLPGVERGEVTVVLRDDGEECHAAWCAGLAVTADVDAGPLLADLAIEGEALLQNLVPEPPA